MDRSFLSRPEVITASRQFVCVRLTTYEDEIEAKFSKDLFATRSGEVENTTFALLAPDGKTRLSRTGRSARNVFADAADMATAMKKIAVSYPANAAEDAKVPPLPVTLDARLGVDVAASDGQLLVAVLAKDEKSRSGLEANLSKLAWSKDFIGKFAFASASKESDFIRVDRIKGEGILIIEPDTFGQSGKVVKQPAPDAKLEEVSAALTAALATRTRTTKSQQAHRAEGISKGAFWIPNLPVTDRQEAGAREGTKRAIENRKK